jgi:hypothetical protein
MRTDTSGIDRSALLAALRERYAQPLVALDFVPKGEDSWGYVVIAGDGRAFFAKVHRAADRAALDAALGVAAHLRDRCNLRGVVAPLRARDGALTFAHAGYPIALFDLAPGTPFIELGYITEGLPPEDVGPVARLIAAVHASAPAFPTPPRLADPLAIPFAARLRRALDAPDHSAGELNPIQRDLLRLLAAERADVAATHARLLAVRDRMRAGGYAETLTHGDPTAGNILKDAAGGLHLIDWGAATLGPAERDLVFFTGPQFDRFLAAYAAVAGPPTLHATLFAFYAYLWALQEIADYAVRILYEDRDPAASETHRAELQPYLPIRHGEVRQLVETTAAATHRALGTRHWRESAS